MARPRVRDLGITPGILQPGEHDAVTDVPGVVVGQTTLIGGEDVRTGVTVLRVEGRDLFREPLVGAVHIINGFGKSLGMMQVRELGRIETPIALTNTLSVWTVADALVDWTLRTNKAVSINPLVGECNDSGLNDIVGRHVTKGHVLSALENANPGPVEEGNVGAGVGMSGFGYKAGVGTSSRVVESRSGTYTVGALVVCNTGGPGELMLGHIAVGRELLRRKQAAAETEDGSIILVVGTDAPLTARQLERVAKRATHGLAKAGAISSHGSGDVVFGFSTAEPSSAFDERREITRLFRATNEAIVEAIGNAVLRSDTMRGRNGRVLEGVPIDQVREIVAHAVASP